MQAFQTDDLELEDVWHEENPANRGRFGIAVHAGTGAASTVVAYLELDRESRVGRHVDSAEETFVVLEGEADVVVGEERARLTSGGVAVGPAMVPHDVVNVGDGVLKLLMFFTSAAVLTEHDDVLAPMGLRAFALGAVRPDQSVSAPA